MINGHIVYIGNHKDLYLETYKDEINTFADTQNVNLVIWDNESITKLLTDKFDKKVLDAYNIMIPYALKADLARLCILYEFGGMYSDLGISFLKKINTDDFDLVLFRDLPVEKIYGINFGIQISVMFSKPKNNILLKAIDSIADTYLAKEYGPNHFYIGAGNKLGELVSQDKYNKIYIGKFGSNFTTIENCLCGNDILIYEQEDIVAHFKSFAKNESLKKLDMPTTDYVYAWSNKTLYEGNLQ